MDENTPITAEDLTNAFEFLDMLIDDYVAVKTDCVKKSIESAIHKTIGIVKDNSLKALNSSISVTPMPGVTPSPGKTFVYADYIAHDGSLGTHVWLPEDDVSKFANVIVRTYSSDNVVTYENSEYSAVIPSYNDIKKSAELTVQKLISHGKAGLTTKIDTETDDGEITYYSKSDIDAVKLSPDEIIEDESFSIWNKYSDLSSAASTNDAPTKKTTKRGKRTKKIAK